jgi:hypothetical protein
MFSINSWNVMHKHKHTSKLHEFRKLGHAPVLAFRKDGGFKLLSGLISYLDFNFLFSCGILQLRDERIVTVGEGSFYTT